MEDTVGDERPIKKEEDDRAEEQDSLLEETMCDQGETESLAESTEGGVPSTSALHVANTVKFKILSPMGGRTLEFAMVRGIANRDAQDELAMHLTNIFKLGLGIKEAFEKALNSEWQDLPWSDVDKVVPIVQRLNKCISSVVSLWRGATRPKTESEWFQNPYCTAEQCKKISFTVFNRVVKNAQVLNKCYKSFSSLTYGETSFDQIQIILDRLKMTEKDVFVDLGSGVGHVVTYAAAYSNAKRCVGIEINNVPADMATKMKKEFEGMMSWYGKKYRPFDLIHGDFLDDTFKKLLTEEATVIYINNFAFDPNLMFNIKQRILEMPSGTRIICTKSLSEEREDRGRGESDEAKKQRPISGRTLSRQTVDMMLDCDELPLADAPVSWSAGKGIQFLLFTVNHTKIEQIFQCAQNSSSGSGTSTRSGSAENVVAPIEDSHTDNSISATIDEVVSAKAPSTRGIRMYPEEDSDDNDDEDYPAPGSSRKNASKAEKRRGGGDGGVPKKRSSTGASSSRHGKKDSKKEAKSTPSSARRFAAATEVPMQHRDTKVKKEDPSSSTSQPHQSEDGRVVLDPSNPLDAHLINIRREYMDFFTYTTTEQAKRKLLEEFRIAQQLNEELKARISHLVGTIEQLLNHGVCELNCRLHELGMQDAIVPSDILNRSKQIVTEHKDITIMVSSVETEVLNLERAIRTTYPHGQIMIEKLEAMDFDQEDPYGVLISQSCAEAATASGEENDLPIPSTAVEHVVSPSTGAPPRRPPRQRARTSAAKRSGGAAGAAAAAAASAAASAQASTPSAPATKADNDEVERQIAEIVQKALQVDHVAKEKERRARSAAGLTVPLLSSGERGDRKKSGVPAALPPTSGPAASLLPGVPVTTTVGAYAAAMMTAAEQLRFQLPSFDHSTDLQQQQH